MLNNSWILTFSQVIQATNVQIVLKLLAANDCSIFERKYTGERVTEIFVLLSFQKILLEY